MFFSFNSNFSLSYQKEFTHIDCSILKFFSIYCVILFILSLVFNTILLRILYLYNELRRSFNSIIITLIILNLIGTIFELPIIIITNFYCSWIFPNEFCIFSAFIMYFIGCSSIYLMVCISFERLYLLNSPLNSNRKKLTKRYYVFSITSCLLLGLIWSSFPLFGWSHYSLEGVQTSCAVEWNEKNFNIVSYNFTILIFVFLLPGICLIINNFKLIHIIKKFRKSQQELFSNKKTKLRLKIERNLILVTSLLITFFLMSWVPYGMVSLYAALYKPVNPYLATLPALFAKSSMLWTSFVYMMTNKQVKKKMFETLKIIKKENTTFLTQETSKTLSGKTKTFKTNSSKTSQRLLKKRSRMLSSL